MSISGPGEAVEGPRTTMSAIPVGRPRVSVDFAIVLRLREEENLGWSRMAKRYLEETGQWVGRDTMKRRYLEAASERALPAGEEGDNGPA